jgi:hypothetical protein
MTATTEAESPATATGDEPVPRSVAEAVRDATATASEHAARVRQSASDAGYEQTLSRLFYTGSYVVAYGVVYAAVFAAMALPQDNPVMHGFRDGGRAALDALAED